jgi:predicted MFS family arabinose efflux permease
MSSRVVSKRTYVHPQLLALAGAFVFLFAGAGAQQQYVVPYLKTVTPWPDTWAGLAVAMVYIGEALTRVPNLALVAGWPDSWLSVIGSVTYVLFPAAVGLIYFVPSFLLLLVVGLLWGWGGSCLWSGSSLQALRYGEQLPRQRQGLSSGLLYFATDAGFLVGVIGLGILHAQARAYPYLLFFVAAALTAVGSVMLIALLPSAQPVAEPLTGSALREALGKVKVRAASFLMLASGLAFGTMLGPFGPYVQERFGRQWLWVTAAGFPIARMVVALAGGILADYVLAGSLLAAIFGATAAGLALVPLWASPWAMAVAAFVLGLLQGSVPVVATAMVGKSAVASRRALPHALIFTFRDVGVTVAVLGALWSRQHLGSFTRVFAVFAVVFAICGLVALVLKRHAEERL